MQKREEEFSEAPEEEFDDNRLFERSISFPLSHNFRKKFVYLNDSFNCIQDDHCAFTSQNTFQMSIKCNFFISSRRRRTSVIEYSQEKIEVSDFVSVADSFRMTMMMMRRKIIRFDGKAHLSIFACLQCV